jgi:lipopolysaccharide exporter
VNHGIAKVLFPVLSSGRSNPATFAQALGDATTTAIKLVVPLGVGMALAAPELVRLVLGDRWVDAIPLFTILAPTLAINFVATIPGQALDAVGRLRWKAVVQAKHVVALGSMLVALATRILNLDLVALVIAAAISLRTIDMFLVAYGSSAITGQLLTSSVWNAAVASTLTGVAVMPPIVLLRSAGASDIVVLAGAVALGTCAIRGSSDVMS